MNPEAIPNNHKNREEKGLIIKESEADYIDEDNNEETREIYQLVKTCLRESLELKDKDFEKIELILAKDLKHDFASQFQSFNDTRLNNITIAVVPDDLWIKGKQPSESRAKEAFSKQFQYLQAQGKNKEEILLMLSNYYSQEDGAFFDKLLAEIYKD